MVSTNASLPARSSGELPTACQNPPFSSLALHRASYTPPDASERVRRLQKPPPVYDAGGRHLACSRRFRVSMEFGVFVPQGWRMDLVEIEDPHEQYEAMTRVAKVAEESGGDDSILGYDYFPTPPPPPKEKP